MRPRRISQCLVCASFATVCVEAARGVSSTWRNSGSSWFSSANWIGGVPSTTQGGVLPASASAISPDIGAATASVQGLAIFNSATASYSIGPALVNGNSTGTLALTGNLFQTGGGTSSLN